MWHQEVMVMPPSLEHYLYSGDVEFLRSVYPIIKSAPVFDQTMVYEPEHNWFGLPFNHRKMCMPVAIEKQPLLQVVPWTIN